MQIRQTRADYHLERKAFHVATVLCLFFAIFHLPFVACWALFFGICVPIVMVDIARVNYKPFNQFMIGIVGPVMRENELNRLAGSTFAIIGVGLSYYVFPPKVAHLSVLFLAIGDPFASLTGITFAGPKIYGNKSLAGLLGGALICGLGSWLYFSATGAPQTPLDVLFICGLIGGVSELTPLGVDDNLSQPLVSGVLLSLFAPWSGGMLL